MGPVLFFFHVPVPHEKAPPAFSTRVYLAHWTTKCIYVFFLITTSGTSVGWSVGRSIGRPLARFGKSKRLGDSGRKVGSQLPRRARARSGHAVTGGATPSPARNALGTAMESTVSFSVCEALSVGRRWSRKPGYHYAVPSRAARRPIGARRRAGGARGGGARGGPPTRPRARAGAARLPPLPKGAEKKARGGF